MNKEIWLTSNNIKRFQKIGNVFFSIVIVLNVWIIIKPLISSFSADDIGIFKLLSNNETYVVLGGLVVLLLVRYLTINFLAVSKVKILGEYIIVQKQFQPDKTYGFSQIVSINSMGYRNVRFLKLSLRDKSEINDCLIFSTFCLLEFENKNVEQVLISLQNVENRNKNTNIELLENIDIKELLSGYKKRL